MKAIIIRNETNTLNVNTCIKILKNLAKEEMREIKNDKKNSSDIL